ncbi:anti-virulence regulator CigR family protein [Halomonas sp.]|uniref:anti-virulence regulator CigR family protein n=1 Tax=Halomonas sp. TaxID=1486246 RepID=UPI0025C71011|nr:anti-virulence regulator CigR family protein [Halomonas sp.]
MSKRIDLRLALASSSLVLLMAAGPALAQPSDNPGRGQGASHGQGQGQGQGQRQDRGEQGHPGRGASRGQEETRQRERREDGYRDRQRREDSYRDRDRRDDRYRSGPSIDERELRRLFGERRDWVREDERAGLPPGIRMNLERGKPLPPGIAKRFDERSLDRLPRYEGYEWRRAGPDAILVDAANDIIYEVIRDILY